MGKERIEAYEQAMNVVCGECGNTDGAQCDECWVRRSWQNMNASDSALEEEPKPKETFVIDVTTILGQTFAIEADSMEDAWEKAKELVNNREFFDEHLHDKWSLDNEWDSAEIANVVDGWDCHGDEDFIAPEIVGKYLKGE
jgi:hypothetical protein